MDIFTHIYIYTYIYIYIYMYIYICMHMHIYLSLFAPEIANVASKLRPPLLQRLPLPDLACGLRKGLMGD